MYCFYAFLPLTETNIDIFLLLEISTNVVTASMLFMKAKPDYVFGREVGFGVVAHLASSCLAVRPGHGNKSKYLYTILSHSL